MPQVFGSQFVAPQGTMASLPGIALGSGDGAMNNYALPRLVDAPIQNAKIMIIDDEPSITEIVKSHLFKAGFRNFSIVTDSSRAMETILNILPDVVLLDIHMRPIDGWQILDAMRREEITQNIPVLVLTSADEEEFRLKAYNLGAKDFLAKPVFASELAARVRNTASAKIYRELMTTYSMQLESDVLSDALTGIPNRRAFDYELKRRLMEWNRQKIPLSLLMIDLDHFKATNDRYGHHVGDLVLRQFAEFLKGQIRDTDLVARFGGEEFAIILPYSCPRESRNAADRTRAALADHVFELPELSLRMTASIGVADITHGDDAELFIRRADAALYAAKRNGRNCCFFHNGATCEEIGQANGSPGQSVTPKNVFGQRYNPTLEEMRIAIVDDEPQIIALVRKYLKDAGYKNFVTTDDASLALSMIKAESPDLVLLDIRMPKINGLEILKSMRADYHLSAIPVLIFTSATDIETRVESLRLGANDYCEKPLHVNELLVRVRNTLMAKVHLDSLSEYSSNLEHQVELRTAELAASRREAIQCLARAAEMRDDNTGRHILRVGKYAAIIAREFGFSDERVVWLEHAAQLHDVGKIGIPDSVLMKPGPLNKEEYQVMQRHCLGGSKIIRAEASNSPVNRIAGREAGESENLNSPLMRMAAIVAETHHERWDGSGYPRGLAGEDIPIEGRITAVADVFDALSTQRPYKKAMPIDQCFKIMAENRGTHFDPAVLDAFFRCKSEIVRTQRDYADD